jgi:hypothetical protein
MCPWHRGTLRDARGYWGNDMHVPRDDEGTPRDVKGCHQGMPTDGKEHPNLILAALKISVKTTQDLELDSNSRERELNIFLVILNVLIVQLAMGSRHGCA